MKLHLRHLAAGMCLATGAAANPEALSYVPSGSEVVAHLDMRAVVDSTLFRALLEKQGEQAQAQLNIARQFTGVDLLKDIDRLWLWGRIQDDDSVTILVEGRLNQDSLVNLLKANGSYRREDVAGASAHTWSDGGNSRYGVFLPNGSVLLGNSRAALESALQTKTGGNGFATTAPAKAIPTAGHAWVFLRKPERAIPGNEMKDTLQLETAAASLTTAANDTTLRLEGVTADAASAARWRELLEGLTAVAQLQSQQPELAELFKDARVSLDEARRQPSLELRVPNQRILKAIEEKK